MLVASCLLLENVSVWPCLLLLCLIVARFNLLRVTKAKLALLVLLAPQVPLVHEAPLETQEKTDPAAPLENQ